MDKLQVVNEKGYISKGRSPAFLFSLVKTMQGISKPGEAGP